MSVLNPVILAAGKSSRFGGVLPKCLARVLGKEILMYSLQALKEAGYSTVTVVVGHHGHLIKDWVESRPTPVAVEFVWNEDNDRRSIHSFHCAYEYMSSGALILESDIIFDHRILELLERDTHQNAVCVTPPRNRRPYLVQIDHEQRVETWGYDICSKRELVGIYKLSRSSVDRLMQLSDMEYWDPLLSLQDPIHCIDCDLRWSEIDTQEELLDAERLWSEPN